MTEKSLPENAYLLALSHVSGLGTRTVLPAIEKLGSAEALWGAAGSILREALPKRQVEALEAGRAIFDPSILWERYADHRLGVEVMGLNDAAYPPLLKETYAPPLVLYGRGNLKALTHRRCLAFVGTRDVSDYGRRVTGKLIEEIAPANPCIVSGLAYGVDAEAHAAALRNNLPTVAVLGSGIDVISPAGNRKLAEAILDRGGAIISEYPLGVQATKYTFPERNRIVAGLSCGTVVVEGGIKSGALITARLALDENRSVFAVPGRIFEENAQGPLRLIRDGAMPVIHGESLLSDLGWEVLPPKALSRPEDSGTTRPITAGLDLSKMEAELPDSALSPLSEVEARVMTLLSSEPISLEELQVLSGLSMARLSEIVTLLELDGWVSALPGARVRRRAG